MAYTVRFHLHGQLKVESIESLQKLAGTGRLDGTKKYFEFKIENHFFAFPEEFISDEFQAEARKYVFKITLVASENGIGDRARIMKVGGTVVSFEDNKLMTKGYSLPVLIRACSIIRQRKGDVQAYDSDQSLIQLLNDEIARLRKLLIEKGFSRKEEKQSLAFLSTIAESKEYLLKSVNDLGLKKNPDVKNLTESRVNFFYQIFTEEVFNQDGRRNRSLARLRVLTNVVPSEIVERLFMKSQSLKNRLPAQTPVLLENAGYKALIALIGTDDDIKTRKIDEFADARQYNEHWQTTVWSRLWNQQKGGKIYEGRFHNDNEKAILEDSIQSCLRCVQKFYHDEMKKFIEDELFTE